MPQNMAELILITIGRGHPVRCTDLDDAKSKAIAAAGQEIILEITPSGPGGPMTTLEFDHKIQDWIAV